MIIKDELLQEVENTKNLHKIIDNIQTPMAKTAIENWLIQNLVHIKFAGMQTDFISRCNEIIMLELIDLISDEKKEVIINKLKDLQSSFTTAVEESKKKKVEVKSPSIIVPK